MEQLIHRVKTDIKSPDFWIRQWQASLAQSAWRANSADTERRIWNLMAADYGKGHRRGTARQREPDNIVRLLADRGLFRKGARVLDIGCGTGRMAIPFARQGARVVALDFSEGMLNRLRDSVPRQLARRIEIVRADWNEVVLARNGWIAAFDLAFASMTPAIRTPGSFLKLHRASRCGCFFQGWAGRREDPLLAGLWRRLLKKDMPPMGWDITLAFNLLRAMGHSPAIEFQDVSWETRQPAGRAADFFANFFSDLTLYSQDALRKKTLGYVSRIAEDGAVRRRTDGQTGMMTWSVK